jgi:hypothetical protein
MGLRLTYPDELPYLFIPNEASPVPTGSRENLLLLAVKKQILPFLESDGLHWSPEIGPRRFAPPNDRVGAHFHPCIYVLRLPSNRLFVGLELRQR